jgi:methylenetetrahydrofolate reductase (NADPH)
MDMRLASTIPPSGSRDIESAGGIKEAIIKLVRGFTIETSPRTAAKMESLADLAPAGTTVFIPSLPRLHFSDIIETAKRLKAEGFNPSPHVTARSIPSAAVFEQYMGELQDRVGVSAALVLAGSAREPAGPYESSMQLLGTGLFERLGIKSIGVAGHPEGSPDIPDVAALSALRWKNDYWRRTTAQLTIVTQFCFEARPIVAWEERIRALGVGLPIRVGIAGPATLKTLLSYAKTCGIGPSMAVLTRQAKNLTRLLSVNAPDILVRDLAVYRAQCPQCLIEGIHVYPFGGHERTAAWLNAVAEGAFSVKPGERGFTLR